MSLPRVQGRANAAPRHQLVEALQRCAPWLDLAEHERSCRDDDDALDAVLAAITAQVANLNLVTVPSPDQRQRAAIKGWIAIPTTTLTQLYANERSLANP